MNEKEQVVNKLLGKRLKISKKRFIEWFYNDRDSMLSLASDVMEDLISDGKYEKDINYIWDECGYIPKGIVMNPEVAEWNKDGEIDIPSSDYDVEWVD